MLDSSQMPTASVPLTRACQNCSHAKAKCVRQTEPPNDKCARCFRLKKQCTIPPRTTRKKRSPNTATHVAQLEQKIENLVTLISCNQSITARTDHLTPPEIQGQKQSPPQPSPPASANLAVSPSSSVRWGLESDPQNQKLTSNIPTQPVLLQPRHTEYLLETFREKMQPQFSFIVVPSNLTSEELRGQRPWLHRAILIVSFFEDRISQMELSTQYVLDLSRAILIHGDKSLDMLESLIIYNAWSYYHSPAAPSNQSSGVIQLAHSLLFDLGLTKPSGDGDGHMESLICDTIRTIPENRRKEIIRTNDERRALLSCYYTGSVFRAALCAKKGEALQHSAYLEFCCQALMEAAEHDSDTLLVSLVRLHSLIEPLSKSLSLRDFNEEFKAPIWMHINSVRVAINNYWNSLPSNIQQDPIMIMSYHCAEIIIYEPSMQNSLFTQTSVGAGTEQRLDMLYNCLNASRKVLEHIMTRPLTVYYVAPMIEFNFIRCGLKTLMKLSLLDVNGWDAIDVQHRVDVLHYFDHIMLCLEKVGAVMDLNQQQCSRDSFPTAAARAMRHLRAWYEAITSHSNTASQVQQPLVTAGTSSLQNWTNLDQFDYLDDAYWLQLMGDVSFMPHT